MGIMSTVLTPYAEVYEQGRDQGRLAYSWHYYEPPTNGDAAMLAGYDAGWCLQEDIETQHLTEIPDSDYEARWEQAIAYAEMMGE